MTWKKKVLQCSPRHPAFPTASEHIRQTRSNWENPHPTTQGSTISNAFFPASCMSRAGRFFPIFSLKSPRARSPQGVVCLRCSSLLLFTKSEGTFPQPFDQLIGIRASAKPTLPCEASNRPVGGSGSCFIPRFYARRYEKGDPLRSIPAPP